MKIFKKLFFILFLGFIAAFFCGFLAVKKINSNGNISGAKINEGFSNFISKISKPDIPGNVCRINDFGAISGGKVINTNAIAKAISSCSEKGGGKIIVPSGKWLTGAIHLKSNIELFLEEGSEIIFSQNPADYLPVVFTRFEGIELYNFSPFIYAKDCKNIAISGKGTLNGQGDLWWIWKKSQREPFDSLYKMVEEGIDPEQRIFGKIEDRLRPSFVQFVNCENISLSDFSIMDGPMWTIHPVYSKNIRINNLRITTNGHNGDGVVVDSSENVLIENSIFETNDDSVSIKSGLDRDGWRVGKPSKNVVIRNCSSNRAHSGVSIGSEMSGGIKNILVENCFFSNIDQGIRVKSTPGRGGFIENAIFRSLNLENVAVAAIQMDLDYDSSTSIPTTKEMPKVSNLYFENISGKNVNNSIRIAGLSESFFEKLTFKNIFLDSKRGNSLSYLRNAIFDNIKIIAGKVPFFSLNNVQDMLIENTYCGKETKKCLEVEGVDLKNIFISKDLFSETEKSIRYSINKNKKGVFIKKSLSNILQIISSLNFIQ